MAKICFMLKNIETPIIPSGDLYGWELTASNTGIAGAELTEEDLTAFDTSGADSDKGTYAAGYLTIFGSQTILNKIITWSYFCDVSAGNITFENCVFRPTGNAAGMPLIGCGATISFNNCDIDGGELTTSHIAISTYGSVYNCRLYNMTGSGFSVVNNSGLSTIQGNYVENFNYIEGSDAHLEGIIVKGCTGTGVLIKRNRFNVDNAAHATGGMFAQGQIANIANMTVEENFFEGYGYNIYLSGYDNGVTNPVITSNRCYPAGFGAINIDPSESVSPVLSGNYYYGSESDAINNTNGTAMQ